MTTDFGRSSYFKYYFSLNLAFDEYIDARKLMYCLIRRTVFAVQEFIDRVLHNA